MSLETALLQWADFKSSEAKLVQWLDEHDKKFKEVKDTNLTSNTKENINQRRTRLRKANVCLLALMQFSKSHRMF